MKGFLEVMKKVEHLAVSAMLTHQGFAQDIAEKVRSIKLFCARTSL
jgi:hypothetical protein